MIPIVYDSRRAGVLRGTSAMLEVSCHPKIVSAIDGMDAKPSARKEMVHPLDAMLSGGVENLEDKEKWSLLTRELVQK